VKPDEEAFEEYIAESLVEDGGYQAVKVGDPSEDFDAGRGLDTAELFTFIEATQAGEWGRLAKLHGGDARARERFADRLAKELDARGTVDVLRHGVVDLGVRVQLAFFKPAHALTPELVWRYNANRLTVTRQLPHEHGTNKALDLALLVNGVPVATAEVKNPLTGQDVEWAKKQYREKRDPKNVTLRRAVIHFAVDPEQVAMTTRLEGTLTRFLPFNRGYSSSPRTPAGTAQARVISSSTPPAPASPTLSPG
jgi:type I restriction enzyme R subunit